jgi:hypothetical protein
VDIGVIDSYNIRNKARTFFKFHKRNVIRDIFREAWDVKFVKYNPGYDFPQARELFPLKILGEAMRTDTSDWSP